MALSIAEISEKVLSFVKLFNVIEERQKSQDAEITLLRKDNAELRKANAEFGERLARLEESRNTVVAEVKTAFVEFTNAQKIQKLEEENAALRRSQLP